MQTFFRTTTKQVDVGGVQIGDGEKVLLFLAAANRDPRRWDKPDTFDVRRRATGHMTFGTGIHGCVGQAVARRAQGFGMKVLYSDPYRLPAEIEQKIGMPEIHSVVAPQPARGSPQEPTAPSAAGTTTSLTPGIACRLAVDCPVR